MKRELKFLKVLERELWKCGRCAYCVDDTICPSYILIKFESGTAKGRILIARALLQSRIDISEDLARNVFTCFLCGACKVRCSTAAKIDTVRFLQAFRAEIVRSGVRIPEYLEYLRSNILRSKTPYGVDIRTLYEERIPKALRGAEGGEAVYYPGCTTLYRFPRVVESTIRILSEAGISFRIMPDLWCCGLPLVQAGYVDLARTLARENLERLEKAGVDTVITSCPACYRFFLQEYPHLLRIRRLPFRVLHITQVIHKALKDGRLKFVRELKLTVTYHDPCELGRLGGIFDEPREILRSIPGLKLVEMERSREESLCCGGGGLVRGISMEASLAIAKERLGDVTATGCRDIVTCCPTCEWVLGLAAKKFNIGVNVMDLVELVHRALAP